MNNFLRIVVFILSITFASSCTINSRMPQGVMATSYLNEGAWHLISSTDIDISGNIRRYTGLPTDSINFAWGQDRNQNVVLTTIYSSINGINSQCNYRYILTGNSAAPPSNTYIPFYLCTPSWKDGYSDTILINANTVTARSAVFKIRYNNINGSGIETDSLGR
ncbi:MAG: hypothetical protein KGL19_10475 [Bacteroidota bacterium]|nr:hypothetical protein [Bacteroidota bacterium]